MRNAGAVWAVAVALLVGGCTGGDGDGDEGGTGRGGKSRGRGASSAPAGRESAPLPTTAEVSAALLGEDDLDGYDLVEPDPEATPPDGSDRPRCLRALNDLDYGIPPSGTAVQARVQFDHSRLGPWVHETLRVHRDEAAARRAFDRTVADLADCAHFTITWSDLARTGTERLRETTGPRLGDRSWAATIEVELGGFPSGETKTLVRQGRLLVVISHAAAPKAPPWAETEDLTRRATDRATRALDDT
ncbi:sensor domain-containing protein [Streptomyces ossamyceticus]|uniref:sensor domain-containing protein n=1 Tax=Streptomyces ossamyceticus TaxID=249581 RepID=UPI0006E25BC1|nr:sensor domain-containing protein [Streptomyces ossamyceticus]